MSITHVVGDLVCDDAGLGHCDDYGPGYDVVDEEHRCAVAGSHPRSAHECSCGRTWR